MSIAGYAGWLAYDTFLIVSFTGRPIYDPNPLKPNPNPKKPVLSSCHVRGLGRTLTPLKKSVIIIVLKGSFDTWVESWVTWVGELGSWELKSSGHFEACDSSDVASVLPRSLHAVRGMVHIFYAWDTFLRVKGHICGIQERGHEYEQCYGDTTFYYLFHNLLGWQVFIG